MTRVINCIKKFYYCLISTALLASCITDFAPSIIQGNKRLVVEGKITNSSGPYFIKLSQTEDLRFSFEDSLFAPASNAVVTISDDQGNSEILLEIEPGLYSTTDGGSGIKGIVGREYQVTIITGENTVYQSMPERMMPPTTIDSFYVVPEIGDTRLALWQKEVLAIPLDSQTWVEKKSEDFLLPEGPDRLFDPSSDIVLDGVPVEYLSMPGFVMGAWIPNGVIPSEDMYPIPSDTTLLNFGRMIAFPLTVDPQNSGFRAYVKYRDPDDEQNFYKWNVKGIFGVNTQPYFFIQKGRRQSGIEVVVNYPKECCSQCWVTVDFLNLFIDDDALRDGGTNTRPLSFIPFNEFYFDQGFYAEVEQESLTREAFQYLSLIEGQANNVGGLFDTAPSLILGNIVNVDQPDDVALGYFRASSVTIKRQFISLSNEQNSSLDGNFQFFDDCRELKSEQLSSTTVKPDFWK